MNNPQEAISSSANKNNSTNVGRSTTTNDIHCKDDEDLTAATAIPTKHDTKINGNNSKSLKQTSTTKKKKIKKQKNKSTTPPSNQKSTTGQKRSRRTPRIVLVEEDHQSADHDQKDGGDDDKKQKIKAEKNAINGTNNIESTRQTTASTKKKKTKSMKRRRLPPGQYEVILRRRAIRKGDSLEHPSKSPTKSLTSFTNKTNPQPQKQRQLLEGDEDEEYGDVSLGMKLTILGGKVIVQLLNPLNDGRASPAQLTGLISRGDVLLGVDNAPLVNLPLDQLMDRLKPLSSPSLEGGCYCRTLKLRFGIGEGLSLLHKNDATKNKNSSDPLLGASWTTPFVDQWSGMPMVFHSPNLKINEAEQSTPQQTQQKDEKKTEEAKEETSVTLTKSPRPSKQQFFLHHHSDESLTENQHISISIAGYKQWDRERYMSAYFSWNEKYSELLRSPPCVQFLVNVQKEEEEQKAKDDSEDKMTRTEILQQGTRVMAGAKVLSYMMESIDKGKDTRSFRKWNSTLSLRSKTSRMSRKKHRAGRFVLDSSSHSMRIVEVSDEENDGNDVDTSMSISHNGTDAASAGGSSGAESLDMDPDEHLLGLAAHDEIWRQQVIHTLEESIHDLEKCQNEEHEKEEVTKTDKNLHGRGSSSPKMTKKDIVATNKITQPHKSLDSKFSMELGSFLFGEQVSQLVKKKKRAFALPPEEITAVLYDLTKIITSATPGEITLQGATATEPQVVITFSKQSKSSSTTMTDDNAALANRFVVEEALPAWLKTFRPLPWDQRRMLCHQISNSKGSDRGFGDALTIGMGTQANSEDDGLTLDSDSTGFHDRAKTSKTLQEQIEDMELDAETKMETCDLVTFYFTQHLLRKLEAPKKVTGINEEDKVDSDSTENIAVEFIERYGAYLELYRCLVKAGEVEADKVVGVLLSMAKRDKIHQAAMKEISKANVLLLYEPTMLSALLKRLRGIRKETRKEYRSALMTLCVSAFPDIRPWQVKKACLTEFIDEEDVSRRSVERVSFDYDELYYEYLSQLLHPTEGHEMARHDQKQVEEWVRTSALNVSDPTSSMHRRQNFYKVASTASSDHRMYHRDLVLLMNLSMEIEEYDLALDLANEIVHHAKYSSNSQIVSNVLDHVRKIAQLSLKPESTDPESIDAPTLQRILRLFHVIETKLDRSRALSIDVSDELYNLLLSQRILSDGTTVPSKAEPSKKESAFIDLLVRKAAPGDVLQMLLQWTSAHPSPCRCMPIIHQTLLRGAKVGVHTELSGSLLRIRQARLRSGTNSWAGATVFLDKHEKSAMSKKGGVWNRMYNGTAVVDK